jgi:hypothetical protein
MLGFVKRNPTNDIGTLTKCFYLSPSPCKGEGWGGGGQLTIFVLKIMLSKVFIEGL